MEKKRIFASSFLIPAAFLLMAISCGPGRQGDAKRDSTVVDSVPATGENEFQQDVVPQSLPSQLDSVQDSVDHKP